MHTRVVQAHVCMCVVCGGVLVCVCMCVTSPPGEDLVTHCSGQICPVSGCHYRWLLTLLKMVGSLSHEPHIKRKEHLNLLERLSRGKQSNSQGCCACGCQGLLRGSKNVTLSLKAEIKP